MAQPGFGKLSITEGIQALFQDVRLLASDTKNKVKGITHCSAGMGPHYLSLGMSRCCEPELCVLPLVGWNGKAIVFW